MKQTSASGIEPGNIWLYHLLKSHQREPGMLGLEDSVRCNLEQIISRLVAGIYDQNKMQLQQVNSAAVNLVLQQALELQREYSPAAHLPMFRSLLNQDPALFELRNEMIRHGQEESWKEASRRLPLVYRVALKRGIILGVLFSLCIMELHHLL